jgi:hypothetical protein
VSSFDDLDRHFGALPPATVSALLYIAGHDVGRYISLEKLIDDSKETTTKPSGPQPGVGTKAHTI